MGLIFLAILVVVGVVIWWKVKAPASVKTTVKVDAALFEQKAGEVVSTAKADIAKIEAANQK